MNKRIKKKWLKALRSGEYTQTRGVLHNDNGFCCLGVLCDIYAKEKKIDWKRKDSFYLLEDSPEYWTGLSKKVMLWADLKDSYPQFHFKTTGPSSLVTLNDERDFSFKQIANVIDRYL